MILSNRNKERLIGIFYLISTAVSIFGFATIGGLTENADYLNTLYSMKNKAFLGVFCHFINDFTVVGIGLLLFTILKQQRESIAISVLSTRIMEGVLLAIGHISFLTLITISKESIAAGGATPVYTTLGLLAQKWSAWTFEVAMLALGIGGVLLSYFLFYSRSAPRWLAVLGIVGYILLFGRSALVLLGYPQGMELFMVGALFEFLFPLWLIFKGFHFNKN
jgi:hypothetical protein